MANESDLGGGMMSNRDTVIIEINGTKFEVGHDVALAQSTYDESGVQDEKFALSDSYLARARGAMHYMLKDLPPETEVIDLLVVGLPVSTYEKRKDALAERMRGVHALPKGRLLHVHEVRVFPQPLGAFFNFMYTDEIEGKLDYEQARNQMNLVIDPGFFTFDWLLAKGMKPIPARSGAVNRGMSAIINSLAEDISKKEEDANKGTVFKLIDEAMRENRPLRMFGKDYDMEPYMDRARTVVNEAVAQLALSVGGGADIDNIMLVGGGAKLFLEAVQDKFPRHTVRVSNNSVYANVVGFQLAGERALLNAQRKERKEAMA